jgi:RNA polymerase sigma-70 factor (ECF subfamily)
MDANREAEARAQLDALFHRVRGGDRKALEAVYKLAAPKLFAIALRVVRRRDVAEDIVQETFLTLWQRRAEYDAARGSPLAWLVTIARHKAIDFVRQPSARRNEQNIDEIDVADEFADPLAALRKAEDEAEVAALLSRLEPERLQMILLAFVFGWSRERLGEHFQKPTGTIKTWLHRSLSEIRSKSQAVTLGAVPAGTAAAALPPAPVMRVREPTAELSVV